MSREDLFTVVPELWLTPTAQYADIVLPVTGFSARSDLTRPWPSGPYFGHMNKAIDPIGECKDDIQIAEELAERLGIKNFKREDLLEQYLKNPQLAPMKGILDKIDDINDKWLRLLSVMAQDVREHVKDYDKYKREGVHRIELKEPFIAFKNNIDDIEKNPFPTPSGKIEIYSDQIASWNNDFLLQVLTGKYPLQLISPHPRQRVHSELYKIEWLMEAIPHRMWINPTDAAPRGIRNGDMCLTFNDRGTVAIEAFVTKRIIPGVVCIYEGAWYNPDENDIDHGGCSNMFTKNVTSPAGAFASNAALIQIEKVGK